MEVIRVRGLTMDFRRRGASAFRAVDDVSFSVESGETLALVGESGSGKSTIGRCVLRLLNPTAGEIYLGDERLDNLGYQKLRELRPRMQIVFQDPFGSMNPAFSVRRTLMEALRTSSCPKRERDRRARTLLEEVHLDQRLLERHRDELSGGQLQRIAIARALASDPEFIFLDEPTSALDVSVRGQVVNLLAELQERHHVAYLLASHELDVVETLAHRVAVLDAGRIVEAGQVERVFADPQDARTRKLVLAESREERLGPSADTEART